MNRLTCSEDSPSLIKTAHWIMFGDIYKDIKDNKMKKEKMSCGAAKMSKGMKSEEKMPKEKPAEIKKKKK